MALVLKIAPKDFNVSLLHEQLAALPLAGIGWAGFIPLDARRYTPFPEATRIVGTSSATGNDVAQRGELRIATTRDLLPAEDATLDSLLSAHVSTVLTAEQVRQDQDKADLDLLASDFPGWDALSTPQKLAILKRLLRLFIRRERGAAV